MTCPDCGDPTLFGDLCDPCREWADFLERVQASERQAFYAARVERVEQLRQAAREGRPLFGEWNCRGR